MIIEIKNAKTIEAVAREFHTCFPFLKIEFYDKPHHWQQASSRKHLLAHDKTIGEARARKKKGIMEIHSLQKTGDLEQAFAEQFGLNVQVFRQHEDAWIQTAGTDGFTLEEQNEIGKTASSESLHGTNWKFEEEKRL